VLIQLLSALEVLADQIRQPLELARFFLLLLLQVAAEVEQVQIIPLLVEGLEVGQDSVSLLLAELLGKEITEE
jgi:hypothetical protein